MASNDKVRKLVFCTGKVYYDLMDKRNDLYGDDEDIDVAVCRVEQLTPFPFDKVAEQAAKYPNAEIVWTQEEPMNLGFWNYVEPRIETSVREILQDNRRPQYVGRVPAAATATGYPALHAAEQNAVVDKTFE